MEAVGEVKANDDTVDGEMPKKTDVTKSQEVLVEEVHNTNLLYYLEDVPPWYTCLALGFQHFLLMVDITVSIPYLLTPLMCMLANDPARGSVASTIIFVSGIVTLLQTCFGVRLPIIQGGTFAFLGPTFALLALMPCPPESEILELDEDARRDLWQIRMQQVQGAVCVAAVFQMLIGFTGLLNYLLKWITPLVITPTIALIGIALFQVASSKSATNWGISSLTIILLILFSQYLCNVGIPWLSYSRSRGFSRSKVLVFKMFPVLIAVAFSWGLCALLTYFDVLAKDNQARTDLRLNVVYEAPVFRVPYPFQWGLPTMSVSGSIGIMAGVVASIIESIGDYYACTRISGAPPLPKHAINRGIFMEGIGTLISGLLGTGNGTTSYSHNIGAIGVTRVASLRVVQYSGMIMLVFGVLGKVGAAFIVIPEPIIGGLFCVAFAMVTSVGMSNLQFVDLNSPRNLFVFGFSFFFGLAMPLWMQEPGNSEVLSTSVPILDQVLVALLSTPMFVGGALGFFLDNTIPGTDEERGLLLWRAMLDKTQYQNTVVDDSCYDLPFGMEMIKKWRWTKYIPIMPTFDGWNGLLKKNSFSPSTSNNM